MTDQRQMIMALDARRMRAMAERDYAVLNELLADDLVYTHSAGFLDTKESLIGNMAASTLVYRAVEPSDVVAQDLGHAMVLTGRAHLEITLDGKALAFGVRFTDVWAKRGAAWQMVAWQATRLPA